jgi:hypothetical protein
MALAYSELFYLPWNKQVDMFPDEAILQSLSLP